MISYERPTAAVLEYRNEYYRIVQVAPGEMLESIDFQPRMDSITVRGQVRSRTGPIRAATVSFSRSGDMVAWTSVETDAMGHYELDGLDPLPSSENLVVAHADGFAGARVRIIGSPGEVHESIDFTLDEEAVLAGSILDSQGQAVSDALLGLEPVVKLPSDPMQIEPLVSNATRPGARNTAPSLEKLGFTYMGVVCGTDPQGRFEMRKVPQGAYYIIANLSSDDTPRRLQTEPIEVRSGQRIEGLKITIAH